MTKAIGLTLTIAGLVLGIWFAQMLSRPGLAAPETFVVAAIAAAMISVGVRYILKSPKKKPKEGSGP